MQQRSEERESTKEDASQGPELETLARNMVRLMDQGAKAFSTLAERSTGNGSGPYSFANEASEAAKTLGEVARHFVSEPAKFAAAQGELLKNYADLWNRSVRRFLGEEVEPVAQPEPGDNRFKDPDWSNNQFFDFLKQSYLIGSRWAEDVTRNTAGVDEKTRQRALFYLNQMLAAFSPSNFALTNPEVIRTTLATNAENLVQGMAHFVQDLEQSKDLLRISQTDLSAFEVGRNLAVTPGKVVFQNDLIQLIQYSPATEEVYERPLLIVPPWINKYYILDLVPEKSFVKWAVGQGFTVFLVSWVNPTAKLAEKTFEDYMRGGILAALGAVNRQTGSHHVNTVGYCVGGTLLAATLAYMAAKGDDRVSSASFLAAQVDFSAAGDLLVFIDDTQLKALEEMMAEQGYLDGSRMAAVFNMLRPRDLIWPYVVNNYLLGGRPAAFDLLYWNADSTNLPGPMYCYYLRHTYLENNLRLPGKLENCGVPIDLGRVKLPMFGLATREDHIVPWRSAYRTLNLLGGGDKTFILGASGHIAGVVNPASKNRRSHWIGSPYPAEPDEWLSAAKEEKGSWWPRWMQWLEAHGGGKRKAPAKPGNAKYQPIEPAPGRYVRHRVVH